MPIPDQMTAVATKSEQATFLPRSRFFLAAAIIVLAVAAAYHNSFTGEFIFDDLPSVTHNASIRKLWPLGPILSPPADSGTGGRPLANLTLALNYAAGRMRMGGYRAVNLFIHLCAALTLFGLVRRTLQLGLLRRSFGSAATSLAAATAVLWAIHPIQSLMVNYVSQRTESLMALFYLLTLYCFVRGTEARPRFWFPLAVVMCVAGMACKEVIITAPIMVFLFDRTFVAGSFRGAWQQRWRMHVAMTSTWAVLAGLLVDVQARGAGYGLGVSWWRYGLTECRAWVDYLYLTIWPHPLVFDRGMGLVANITEVLPQGLVVLALLAGTLIAVWGRPTRGFVGCWFFLIPAPTSSIVPIVHQPIAENRMYLALAAVAALAVIVGYSLAPRRWHVGAFAVAAALGLLTVRRNEDFRTAVSIWADTAAKCPENPRAHNNLAFSLLNAGRLREATAEYEVALRLDPNNAESHVNLSDVLIRSARLQEAIAHAERAVELDPNSVPAHNNLGYALVHVGRLAAGIVHYRKALEIDPAANDVRNNLAYACYRSGAVSEAIEQYQTILKNDPNFSSARQNLEQLKAQGNK